ncbi:MAG: Flp pilus assembly complex ATPase component TadA [Planctomycetes bacterium]|nr:Flp pilus assembly complex ATPase component TadA [Planctomycetota bacterium]
MSRCRCIAMLGALAFCALFTTWATAQNPATPGSTAPGATADAPSDGWPKDLDRLTNLQQPTAFQRGKGGYLSPIRLGLCWLVFLGWIATTDWVNRDAQQLEGAYYRWNTILVASFMGALVVVWLLDSSIMLTLPVLLGAWLAPVGLYVFRRNSTVGDHEKVLTPEHVRFVLAPHLKRLGIKITVEKKAVKKAKDAGPPIDFNATAKATKPENMALSLNAKDSPGFKEAGLLVIDALQKRASQIMLDFTREGTVVRYQIDSVWSDAGPRDRQTADPLLATLKSVAGMKAEERAAKQRGKFEAVYEKAKYRLNLQSGGTKTGERAIVRIDTGAARKARFTDLNLSAKQVEDLTAALQEKQGLVLVSAPTGHGLTTLISATTASIDRFTRNVMAIEEASNREMEVENVQAKTYDAAEGRAPDVALVEAIREFPEAIVFPEVTDGKVFGMLCEQVNEGHMIIAGLRAREVGEALLKVLMLKIPIKVVGSTVTAVVNQRLVRKLCTDCREAYDATPQMLQQFRLPADKVTQFYRPPQADAAGKKKAECKSCGGTGYRGVTGLVEVLFMNDAMRAALANLPKVEPAKHVDYLRQSAQKAGMRTLQEEGIVLLAQGITSLPELKRALTEKE